MIAADKMTEFEKRANMILSGEEPLELRMLIHDLLQEVNRLSGITAARDAYLKLELRIDEKRRKGRT
jgi:hypothetical protein